MSEMCSCCFGEKEQRGFAFGDGDLCIKCANVFGKAKIVEWRGEPLCELGGGEYFDGQDELIEKFIYRLEPGETPYLPRYMHPCDHESLSETVSAHRIARMSENICEELRYEYDREGECSWFVLKEDDLKDHITAWLENHDIFFFKEDTSKIVDLTDFWKEALEEVGSE